MKKVLIAVGASLVLSVSAQAAVKLKNEDSRSYDLEVVQGSTTKHTLIQAGVTVPRQCTKACTIKIKNGPSVRAPNGSVVSIKNGAFSVKK